MGLVYLRKWLIFMVNLGKYTSPMDPSWKWASDQIYDDI